MLHRRRGQPQPPLTQHTLDLLHQIPHAADENESDDHLTIVSVDKPTPTDFFIIPRVREGVNADAVERQALALHKAPADGAAVTPPRPRCV